MGVGSVNYYSILAVFVYLSGWLLGYPFIGNQLKWLFIKPIYCIVFVLLLVLWLSIGLFCCIFYFDEKKSK